MADSTLNEKIVKAIKKIEFFEENQIFPVIYGTHSLTAHTLRLYGQALYKQCDTVNFALNPNNSLKDAFTFAMDACFDLYRRHVSKPINYSSQEIPRTNANILHLVNAVLQLEKKGVYIVITRIYHPETDIKEYAGKIYYHAFGSTQVKRFIGNDDKWQLLQTMIEVAVTLNSHPIAPI